MNWCTPGLRSPQAAMAETSEKIPIAMAGPEELEPCLPPAYTAETMKPSSSSRLLKIGAVVLIAGAALLLFGAIGAFYFWKVEDKHVYNIHYSMSINGKIEEGSMEIDPENNMEMFRTGSGPDEAVEVHDFHIGITGIRFSGGEKCFIKTQVKAHLPEVETLNKESLMFDLEDEIMPAKFDEESLIWVAADQPLKDNSFLSAKILELCGDLPIFWLRPTYPKGGRRRRRDVQRGKRQAVTEAMAAMEITPTEQPVTKEMVTEETTGMAGTVSLEISPTEETGTKETITEDITVGDAITVEMTLADTVTGETATVDTTYDPTAATEISSADLVTAEIASADLVTAGIPSADLVTAEIASADLVTAGISSGDLITVEMTSADLVTMEIASADSVTVEMVSGDVVTVELTSGDLPTMEMTSGEAATVAVTPAEVAREEIEATEMPIPQPTVVEHKTEATTKKATVEEEEKEEEPPYNPENPYQQRNLEGEEGTMTFDPMLDHQGICCTECTRGHTHCQRICEPLGGYHPWPYHYRGCRVACRVIMPCRWWVGRILGIL